MNSDVVRASTPIVLAMTAGIIAITAMFTKINDTQFDKVMTAVVGLGAGAAGLATQSRSQVDVGRAETVDINEPMK